MRGFAGMALALLVCMGLLVLVNGCTTLRAVMSDNVTVLSTEDALCQDAMKGLAIWTIWNNTKSPEAAVYWEKYRAGVEAAIGLYCAKS